MIWRINNSFLYRFVYSWINYEGYFTFNLKFWNPFLWQNGQTDKSCCLEKPAPQNGWFFLQKAKPTITFGCQSERVEVWNEQLLGWWDTWSFTTYHLLQSKSLYCQIQLSVLTLLKCDFGKRRKTLLSKNRILCIFTQSYRQSKRSKNGMWDVKLYRS